MVNAARRVRRSAARLQGSITRPRAREKRLPKRSDRGLGACRLSLSLLTRPAQGLERFKSRLSHFASVLQTARFGGKPQYRPTRLQ